MSNKTILFFSKKIYVNSQTFVREQLRALNEEIPEDWNIILLTEGDPDNLKSQYPWMENMEILNPFLKKGVLINVFKGLVYVIARRKIRVLGVSYIKKIFTRYSFDKLRSIKASQVLLKQFASNADIVIKMKDAGLLSYDRLLVTCRGHDVSQAFKRNPHIYDSCYSRVDAFLPVSSSLGEQLMEHSCPAEKIQTIHSGLKTVEIPFEGNRDHGDLTLFSVGRLTEKKGHAYTINAIKLLKSSFPNLKLEIAGKGPEKDNLQSLIDKLDLKDNVFLLGALSHEEVLERMRASDIFVLHSITSSTGDMEGIPNVIKEAMLSGSLVVSTDHSGIKELVPLCEDGVLVPEKDSQAMAEKIKDIWQRKDEWKTQRRNSYRDYIVNEFDSHQVMKKLIPIILG